MRSLRFAAAIAALALPATLSAQAGAPAMPKIAYINSQLIISQAPGRQAAEAQFEREMGQFRQTVQRMGDSLQTLIADYSKVEVSLSPAAKETRQKAIRTREEAYQKRTQELEQQAQQRQLELVQPIMERIQKTIAEIRAEEGYAMIFDAGSNAGVLVAADTTLNITNKVLARMGVTGTAANAPIGSAPPVRPLGAPATAPAGVSRPRTNPNR